uniref:protein-serine/threonine phosphatase n=1 Tax=Oryza rufipogon TaxID=4529 RepID=A0A0E0MXX3_ORYRU
MALLSPRVPRLPLASASAAGAGLRCCVSGGRAGSAAWCHASAAGSVASSSSELEAIRWGTAKLQGARDEMEDEVVLRPGSLLDGFSFAAVFDGHAGFSAVEDELYKECAAALDGGAVLSTKNLDAITDSIQRAFATVDANLSTWLEQMDKEDESGATATAMFLRNDVLVVSHIGDSCLVVSRGGRPQAVTNFHRPYGNKKASLEEVKRIRAAGGWIVDGRICGEISVSRAFGDIRFKTRKNEMLVKGVKEGRWTEKFISRINFKGDLIVSSPDVSLVELGPDVEFVLLATDGLWDYIKSSEAVALVRDQLRQHGDVQVACEALGQIALDRRSQDNISIVIADLGRTNWKELPAQRPNLFLELTQAVATVGAVSLGIYISSLLALQ